MTRESFLATFVFVSVVAALIAAIVLVAFRRNPEDANDDQDWGW